MESWIHVNPNAGSGNDVVQITVDHNTTNGDRIGTINVATSTLNKTVIVKQSAPEIFNLEIQIDTHNNTILKYIVNGQEVEFSSLAVLFMAIESDEYNIFNININIKVYNQTAFMGAVKGVYIEKSVELTYNVYGQFKENEIRITFDFNTSN